MKTIFLSNMSKSRRLTSTFFPTIMFSRTHGEFRERLVLMAEAIVSVCPSLDLENLRGSCLNYEKLIMNLVEVEKKAAGNDSDMQIAASYLFLFVRCGK